MADLSPSVAPLPYRPPTPNAYWLEGEEARKAGEPRAGSVRHAYSGDRWEWEAGWDYADALRRDCSDCGHLRVNHSPSSGRCDTRVRLRQHDRGRGMTDHLSQSETCESIDGEEMEVVRRGLNVEINAWDREDDEMLWTVALDPYNAKRLAFLLDSEAGRV